MYFHMNKHHKKVMKSQKNVHCKGHTAKIFYDLYKGTRVSQIIVLTSQTEKFLWATRFSHYLGQKHYRNAKKFEFFQF